VRSSLPPPQSVLVYSVEEISGDGLIKLPFVAGVRAAFPDAHFAWCAATGNCVYDTWLKPVVAGQIDEMVLQGRPGLSAWDMVAPGRPLGRRRFDLVIDTQSNVKRSLAMRRVGRTFISPAAKFMFSARRPDVWPDAMMDRMETLLKLAAGEGASLKPLRFTDPAIRAAAETLLPAGPTYVGFAPGAGGPERRWPLDRYIELARRQHERGRVPVFVLGPAERDYLEPIHAKAPFALLPGEAAPPTSVGGVGGPLLTIALAGRFAAGVAADAGPGHMLAAGGSPLVSLFRERRKALKFRPAAPRIEALIAEDYGDKLMDLIPLEDVDAALERLLAG
jgi:ADP-heptose:LPS heptosyltransferase